MSTTTTYPFDHANNYTYDSDLIEFVGGKAQLKLQDYPNQTFEEDFATDTGFTYDNTKAEFSGGQVEQKLVKLNDDVIGWAAYSTSIDFNFSPDEVGTSYGGASVVDSRLDLNGETLKYVTYGNTNIGTNTGAIRFKITPNYSGAPATLKYFISYGDATTLNRIDIRQNGTSLNARMYDSAGALLGDGNISFNPVAGTTYEIEFNWDIVAGEIAIYVDGIKQLISTSTGTRTNSGLLYIGTNSSATFTSDFEMEDLVIFDSVQHISDYTPGYTLSDYLYLESFVESETLTAAGSPDGTLISIDAFTVDASVGTLYTFGDVSGNHYYFNGSTWAISDKSYSQANIAADLSAYLVYFPFPEGTTQFRYGIVFPDGNTQNYIADLDVEYTHQIYPTTNPTIVPNSTFRTSDWESISATTTAAGSDAVKFTSLCGSQDRYVTGGSATNSDGTYAQSSTIAELQSDIGDLITGKCSSTAKIFLHSEDGLTTPNIDLISIAYNQTPTVPTFTVCSFDGYIYDHDGPLANEVVQIRPFQGFVNSTALHKYEWKTLGTTDADGWFTADIYVQATNQFWEMKVGSQRYKFQLPDSGEADFSTLTAFEVVEV